MKSYKYIYGPVPSRRMGLSLGVSPIIEKTCNYSCVYCQLGHTKHMTNERYEFINIDDIIEEFKDCMMKSTKFDVVTIVGEGEPTLYLELKKLILEIKKLVDQPVAVITNGALLYDDNVKDALMNADIVLPSMDAYDEKTFKTINRPMGVLKFPKVYQGLVDFSKVYKGQLWIEIMLIDSINDDQDSINQFEKLLQAINYDRLFINTPVRPPTEKWVKTSSSEKITRACKQLGGISIENLVSKGFSSDITDDYQAVLSIIGRHPMNQHEIISFLIARGCKDTKKMILRLEEDAKISSINYKGYITYRIKEY